MCVRHLQKLFFCNSLLISSVPGNQCPLIFLPVTWLHCRSLARWLTSAWRAQAGSRVWRRRWVWTESVEASPPQPAPPCLLKTQTWVMMITIWKVRNDKQSKPAFIISTVLFAHLFAPICHLHQVMWMMRWRRSFPSTCSLGQTLALDLLPFPPLAVAHVPPLPMENLQPQAGLVVDNPPDLHKVNAACRTAGIKFLNAVQLPAQAPVLACYYINCGLVLFGMRASRFKSIITEESSSR